MQVDWKTAGDSETVCYCNSVDKGTIASAIRGGAETIDAIQKATTACTGKECAEKNPNGRCCSVDIIELFKIYGTGASRCRGEGAGGCDC